MKVATTGLLILAATANAASHARACTKGCASTSCDKSDVDAILTNYDKLVADNKASGAGANSLHKGNATKAVDLHDPFFCKVKKTRRERELAAHVQMTLRVAVAGNAGSKKSLHPMEEAHWIDYITVVDATSSSRRRDLAAHAKTLLYLKGTQKDGTKGVNACFDFDLLKSAKVTHIKAAEHCNLHGLWWSPKIDVNTIPDCEDKMVSSNGRRLAAHAGKCFKVENGATPCPESPAPAPGKASESSYTTISGVFTAVAVGVMAMIF